MDLVTITAIVSSYRAAFCGNGGFTGLQKQLHPEVHIILFRRFHARKFGKLTIHDVRLHNGCHKPEMNISQSLIHFSDYGNNTNNTY